MNDAPVPSVEGEWPRGRERSKTRHLARNRQRRGNGTLASARSAFCERKPDLGEAAVRLRRFGPPGGPLAGVEINSLLISFGALLRHLRKLPSLVVERTQVWVLTDDHWADLRYRGFRIWVDSEFVDFDVRPGDGCPSDVFLEVVGHLEAYEPWAINRLIASISERVRSWKVDTQRIGREIAVGDETSGARPPGAPWA